VNFAEQKVKVTQTANPLVSTIVLSYNQCQYVLETLESVKAQSYKFTQFIIVDDYSTDDSIAIIDRWIQANKINCTFIRHKQNQGICKSLNDALAIATGKYISMVASDDVWLPDKIARQVEIMESQSDQVGVLYSDALQIDRNGHTLPGLLIATHWKQLQEKPQGQVLDVLLVGNFIPGLTTLIRRSCYDEVGLYDENLPWEDWDMWMRIARHHSFLYSPTPSAKYRIHEKSLSHSNKTRMLKELVKIGLKQFGLGDLTENQKSTLSETLLNSSAEVYRQDDVQSADILLAVWQATRDKRAGRMYRFAKFGFSFRSWQRANLVGDTIRVRLWHPILNATLPVRHALGLRRRSVKPPLKNCP
jgi:glycosyltransferase involved in cell wall biosynthesis